MNYLLACHTDVGVRKKTNQDSMLIERALVDGEQIVLAVMCDGMGGLEKGELASAETVMAFSEWFRERLPQLLDRDDFINCVRLSWEDLLQTVHRKLYAYGEKNKSQLGTTVTAMLLTQREYCIAHVGDSRVYEIREQVRQLTKDQTLVQREIDRGNLTPGQARTDRRRSVLLQCIGASDSVIPEFYVGNVKADTTYLLCCDGFRHEIDNWELQQIFAPEELNNEKVMEEKGEQVTKMVINRGEKDNVSVILVRSWEEQ